jgi:hypothetical protein
MSKRTFVTRLVLLVIVGGLIYGGIDLAGAASPPNVVTGSVTVANTPSNPVPVQQQGTATVSVNNASIPITGTVKIDPSTVVHTSDANIPAFQPVEKSSGTAGGGDLDADLYTVPAGKELVVDEITALMTVPTDTVDLTSYFYVLDPAAQTAVIGASLPMITELDQIGPQPYASEQTQFYAGPGTHVECHAQAEVVVAMTMSCSFAGHLVDLPS